MLAAIEALCEAAADARDAAGERAAALERRMLGAGDGDDVTERLRACSRQEAELQARLRQAGEAVTEAEVRVAHVADRRADAAAELERIAATVGHQPPATGPLDDSERAAIEEKLGRLGRRREQLGPGQSTRRARVRARRSRTSRTGGAARDLETALAELQSLIRDTDRKIHAAFEETFEATERNFEELVEHLFPGGRGRLRLVDEGRGPSPVLGGAEVQPDDGEPDEDGAQEEEEFARRESRSRSPGRQGDPAAVAALRRREVARRARLRVLGLPRPALALLHPRRGRGGARRRQHRPLPAARRRFSDRAQFVIVTHQKRTMDAAEVLYGV